jgi:uroporphyrinogen-III synthase
MKILLTRRSSENSRTSKFLVAKGFKCLELALSQLVATDVPMPSAASQSGKAQLYDCLILTSAAALEIIRQRDEPVKRSLKVYAVGGATAHAAANAGFSNVVAGPGNAPELAQLILTEAGKRALRARYPCSTEPAFDMKVALGDSRVELIEWPIYKIEMMDPGHRKLKAAIDSAKGGFIFQYSAASARHLVKLFEHHGLLVEANEASFIAISPNTANILLNGGLKRVFVADSPTTESMVQKAKLKSDPDL